MPNSSFSARFDTDDWFCSAIASCKHSTTPNGAATHTDPNSPSCTHCIDAKVACHYPEAKQRGPQVYQQGDAQGEPVDRIVKRLQERYANMPYSAKTSEWNQQPLLAEEDRQRWWLARQQIVSDGDSPYGSVEDRRRRAMSHSSARTVDTGEPGFIHEQAGTPFSPADTKSVERPLSSNPSPGVNIPANVDPEIAAELDEEQLQKYF